MTSLDFSEFPDLHDPHRCGTAPFVPNVNGPRQNSCGSYELGFKKNGCNKYMPNYPDDLYIENNGCEGLADCYNGKLPKTNMIKEGQMLPKKVSLCPWPADGYLVPDKIGPACRESFVGTSGRFSLLHVILIVAFIWLIIKIKKSCF